MLGVLQNKCDFLFFNLHFWIICIKNISVDDLSDLTLGTKTKKLGPAGIPTHFGEFFSLFWECATFHWLVHFLPFYLRFVHPPNPRKKTPLKLLGSRGVYLHRVCLESQRFGRHGGAHCKCAEACGVTVWERGMGGEKLAASCCGFLVWNSKHCVGITWNTGTGSWVSHEGPPPKAQRTLPPLDWWVLVSSVESCGRGKGWARPGTAPILCCGVVCFGRAGDGPNLRHLV